MTSQQQPDTREFKQRLFDEEENKVTEIGSGIRIVYWEETNGH